MRASQAGIHAGPKIVRAHRPLGDEVPAGRDDGA